MPTSDAIQALFRRADSYYGTLYMSHLREEATRRGYTWRENVHGDIVLVRADGIVAMTLSLPRES